MKSNQEIFTNIYAKHAWGNDPSAGFHSGSGSRGKVADEYTRRLAEFIKERPHLRTMVDIGCGDFEVAKQLLNKVNLLRYCGIDVVQSVIDNNLQKYGTIGIDFKCLDATKDELPVSSLCCIRQVLQHLSNNDIQKVLNNISGKYKYVLVTEHVERCPKAYNIDKPTNGRCRTGSGVYLDKAPFDCKTEELWRIKISSHKDLVTTHISI